jgi:transposase-like protein
MTDKPKKPASHTEARFVNEDAAREHLEATRWPLGPVCPKCGGADRQSRIEPNEAKKIRAGLLFCGHCRSQYTVTVGTVFEDSHLPLHKWVYAIHLMCASKKGISSLQLSRVLGVSYKTAWFMSHRIRHAMEQEHTGPLGSEGGPVEADETYYGYKRGRKAKAGTGHKHAIFTLVERSGKARSFHVADVTGKNLKAIIAKHVAKGADIMTDEHGAYIGLHRDYQHSTVRHKTGEYVRGSAHTNTVEGYFSILKRGLIGTYHHVSEQHLQRYVNEFDFRYNHRQSLGVDDQQRAHALLRSVEGKRLTYRRIGGATKEAA